MARPDAVRGGRRGPRPAGGVRLLLALPALAAMAAAGGQEPPAVELDPRGPVLAIYSELAVELAEDQIPEETEWLNVAAKVSDPELDFGYLDDRGVFLVVATEGEGSLDAFGDTWLEFALRERGGDRSVYPLAEFGTCELVGEPLDGARAALPPMTRDYYPSAVLNFVLPGGRTVRVELSTRPPNGFSLPVRVERQLSQER